MTVPFSYSSFQPLIDRLDNAGFSDFLDLIPSISVLQFFSSNFISLTVLHWILNYKGSIQGSKGDSAQDGFIGGPCGYSIESPGV